LSGGSKRGAGADDRLAAPAPDLRGPLANVTFSHFVISWNLQQGRATPDVHQRMAAWLDERWAAGDRRLLLMVFRDAGKSTIVGLFCAWLLGQDPDLRLLVLSAEGGLATKMTRNVRRIIERNPLLRHLLPRRREEWAADQLTITRSAAHRDPSMLARGIGANITGCRADIVICDDVEVPNTAGTSSKRLELRERLREASFVLVPDGTQLYIGTPHSYYSIYADETRPEMDEPVPFLASYVRMNIPLLDTERAGVWPDRFEPQALTGIHAETGPTRFRSQMMLTPSHNRDVRLDPDRLVRYDAPLVLGEGNGEPVLTIDGRRMVGTACWWDPALARPERGDASVVAAVFTDDSGGYWLHAIRYLQVDHSGLGEEDVAAQLCRQVAGFVREQHQPSIAVETNGIGRFLPSLLRRELDAQGQGTVVTEQVSTVRKDQRILGALDPLLAAGALRAHASVWRTPFIQEMREWLPGGRGSDDGLDAVSGCILSQPVRLNARRPAPPRRDWRHSGSLTAKTMFVP
jgi:hypothetical protein